MSRVARTMATAGWYDATIWRDCAMYASLKTEKGPPMRKAQCGERMRICRSAQVLILTLAGQVGRARGLAGKTRALRSALGEPPQVSVDSDRPWPAAGTSRRDVPRAKVPRQTHRPCARRLARRARHRS